MTAINIFGPGHYGSTRETATRPTPIATNKGFDAWFDQCAVDGTGGTKIDEMFLNFLIASLRKSVRTAGAAEAELSDVMLAEAMARYASGGIYATDGGTLNTFVLSASALFQPVKSYFAGMVICWTPSISTTGAATVAAFGLAAKALRSSDGYALVGGECPAGVPTAAWYDPTGNSGAGAFRLFPWADTLITGAVTRTVHGGGADFADLNAAMAWLARRRIASTGSVTFNVAAGQYTYTANLDLRHPDAARVTIAGAALLAGAPTAATFQCSGYDGSSRTTDRTAHLAALRAIYATEIHFTGAVGLRADASTLQRLLVSGDRTAGAYAGVTANGTNLDRVSIQNFGDVGLNAAGTVIVGVVTISGCNDGIHFYAPGNYYTVADLVVASNDNYGAFLLGSALRMSAGVFTAKGCGVAGLCMDAGSSAGLSNNAVIRQNAVGIRLAQAQFAAGSGMSVLNNGTSGIAASQSTVYVPSAAFSGNGSDSINATDHTNVFAVGSTGVTGTCSPAANALGNRNALITV